MTSWYHIVSYRWHHGSTARLLMIITVAVIFQYTTAICPNIKFIRGERYTYKGTNRDASTWNIAKGIPPQAILRQQQQQHAIDTPQVIMIAPILRSLS
jgi:cell division protein YceG involved in septum cleavage